VDALLEARSAARTGRRYQEADRLRDRLLVLGVEVRDTPDGTEWQLDAGS
jgi:cysteinyl-tRNA synthetase